jgi:uncharacterized protein YjeT (DUF2065 family)
MRYIVYLLGFTWIAAGAIVILYPDDYRAFVKGLLTRLGRIYLAMIPVIFGLLLLFAASSTGHSWFIGTIGVLGIVKGALIYFNPGGFFELSKNWLETLSDQGYRLVGIIALVLGTVVISWIQ